MTVARMPFVIPFTCLAIALLSGCCGSKRGCGDKRCEAEDHAPASRGERVVVRRSVEWERSLISGKLWREPLPKPPPPTNAIVVERYGTTMQSAIGPGFTVSGEWPETGGASTGRYGRTATSGVWIERGATTGEIFAHRLSGILSETRVYPEAYGTTMRAGAYPETGMRVGITPVER